MQETEESLVDIGLTSTEARIYLAGLGSEFVTIQDLTRKTKIKRPTVYHAVGTLVEKGLVAEKKTANKLRFSMSSPENIRGIVERQKERVEQRANALEALIPLLLQQANTGKKDKTSIVQYEGIEGMKMVMDIAFYCKSRHWDVIAPIKNFLREYDKEYAARYLNARKYHGITSRVLWEFYPGGRELTPEEVEERNPRFMPAAMQGKFKSMLFLFDDKIAMFSSFEGLSAILITSKELHAMFLAMYEGLWEVSERYN